MMTRAVLLLILAFVGLLVFTAVYAQDAPQDRVGSQGLDLGQPARFIDFSREPPFIYDFKTLMACKIALDAMRASHASGDDKIACQIAGSR